MRVVLRGNIVEIRAKACEEGRFTKTNTMDTMNWLSICLSEAAKYNEEHGHYACAEEMQEAADNLYEKLKRYKYYDRVK